MKQARAYTFLIWKTVRTYNSKTRIYYKYYIFVQILDIELQTPRYLTYAQAVKQKLALPYTFALVSKKISFE